MISIYTRTNNLLKKEFWKWAVKKALGKYSGPDAVLESLTRGLTEGAIHFEVNPWKPRYQNIHVLSGIQVLRDRIQDKTSEQTLIAGPTLVVTPKDQDGILLDKKIDIILTPSQWVTDFYASISPEIQNKTYAWPAGVTIPAERSQGKEVIIFKKNIDEKIFEDVTKNLDQKNISYTVLTYGNFKKAEYLNLLKNCSYMVYLQTSESQGIALQEAWSYNVPTLVYRNTEFVHGNYSWHDEKIAAPYLSNQAGLFFTLNDFDDIISTLNLSDFAPKAYCEANLSDSKSAEKLLHILQNYEKNH